MNLPLRLGNVRSGGVVWNVDMIYDATGEPWGQVFGVWQNMALEDCLKNKEQALRITEAQVFVAAVNEHSTCTECGGKGWMMNRENPQQPHIAACEICNRFEDDFAALEYVANRACARKEEL